MTYNVFLELLDRIDRLDKEKYNELKSKFDEYINVYFDKYINSLNQSDYIKNMPKFEYYLNTNTFHTIVNHKYLDPNLTAYYNDIYKYPVLDSDEETIILKKIYKLKSILNKRNIDDDYITMILNNYGYNKEIKSDIVSRKLQLKFLKKITDKDFRLKKYIREFELYVYYNSIKEYFINCNLRLVTAFLKKKDIKPCDMLDYIQWGNEGLLEAVNRYDAKYNTKFSTYAYYWINCKINAGFFRERKKVKSSYGMYYLTRQFSKFCSEHYNKYGEYPTKEEKIEFIYKNLYENKKGNIDTWYKKCDEKLTYIENIYECERATSLDIDIGESLDDSIVDMIVDKNTDIEKEATDFELKELFKKVFSNLTNKQICIILLRNGMGINNYLSFDKFQSVFPNLPLEKQKKIWVSKKEYTLQEIGDFLDVSRQDVSAKEIRIKKKIIKYKYVFGEYIDF